jgi:hypothetical protein
MGSSKIIMLSGIYLIFGFYIKAYHNVDEMVFKASVKAASMAQTEQLAQTGVTLAKSFLGGSATRSLATQTFVSGLDTVRYSAVPGSLPSSQTMVTSVASHYTTIDVDGVPTIKVVRKVTQTALMQYHNSRWKQLKIYTTRSYQDNF